MVQSNPEMLPERPKQSTRLTWCLGILTAIAFVWLVVWFFSLPAPEKDVKPKPQMTGPLEQTPFFVPGIQTPKTERATDVNLPDDTPVIGVEANGKFRAYRVQAFHSMFAHVVNDLIDDTPITVTYCDRTLCANVFTDKTRKTPLKIDLGGYKHRMFLNVNGGLYFQDTGEPISEEMTGKLPYGTYPFKKTTWKVWRDAHPTTDIYVAPPPRQP